MDLDGYYARIGYAATPSIDTATLFALHRSHATSIPFENLDIQMGRPVALAVDRLEEKLVRRRRGGYCFEQKTLLLHVLRAIGFEAIGCEARVLAGATAVTPRTHMVVIARAGESQWLCDVGFGGDTPLEPVPLDGSEVEQGPAAYRVARRGDLHALQAHLGDGWSDQYVLEAASREPIDFDVANWYTSTFPESAFVKTLTAQQRTPVGSKVLRNLRWTVRNGDRIESVDVGRGDIERLLEAEFGLAVPSGSRFRALDGE